MAYSSSSSNANSKVHTCSTECEQSYANLKKLYDQQREQLGDASIDIQAYTLALKKSIKRGVYATDLNARSDIMVNIVQRRLYCSSFVSTNAKDDISCNSVFSCELLLLWNTNTRLDVAKHSKIKFVVLADWKSFGRISDTEAFGSRLELAIPGQTTTGKESSNPFMAGSLPKTIHFCDSLQSDDDSFELIELMILCTNFLTMGRIDDADVEVTFIDETSNDARNKNNKISNSN
ncbi:hypothetical protein Tco_0937464 [Tanacetum coccineum]|uniref:C2 NT-type domain-containing protein n=1 Tax=Tanacetum coccineum TaxID=301880 RepID=A0ABQ5DLD5_9ASTR